MSNISKVFNVPVYLNVPGTLVLQLAYAPYNGVYRRFSAATPFFGKQTVAGDVGSLAEDTQLWPVKL